VPLAPNARWPSPSAGSIEGREPGDLFIPVMVAGLAPVDVGGMTGKVERLLDTIVRRI
jgi:hypothetical protein